MQGKRMKRWLIGASVLFLMVSFFSANLFDQFFTVGSSGHALVPQSGPRILTAATDFYEALSPGQRKKAVFAYGGPEHEDWHFIPRARKGVALNELNSSQRGKLTTLLKVSLSEIGYTKAEQVRQLESILALLEGAGRRFARDPELYFTSFFSAPSESGEWGWRFEGHHLCFNFTLKGNKVTSSTPAFYGANPSIVDAGPGRVMRVLVDEELLARQLVTSLTEKQRKACLGEEVPDEVPSTQKMKYDGALPAGVAGSSLDDFQKALLKRLIGTHIQNFPTDIADAEWQRFAAGGGLDSVHFAWRGGTKHRDPHTYLVHGASFVINYSNTQNSAAHIHSSYRRQDGDIR